MDIFLVVIALILAVVGFFNLSNATLGIGIIGCGCLFGILARIAQASKHQEELLNKLSTKEKTPTP
jgi:hypothetical protein